MIFCSYATGKLVHHLEHHGGLARDMNWHHKRLHFLFYVIHTFIFYSYTTGKLVHRLEHHGGLVRDMNWHPYEPKLGSVSWDGIVQEWEPPSITRPK